MAILTRDQIEKLSEIIRKHANWVTWRLLGDKFVSQADIDALQKEGILPMGVQTPMIKYSFVLGRLEALLKEGEWKGLTYDQLVEKATSRHTDLQKLQIEAAEMSANITLRGLFEDIQAGVFEDLAQATNRTVTEAVVQGKVAEEIKEGVTSRKNYIEVAHALSKTLKENERNWYRVASTEMHAAREKGVVSSILAGEDVYRRADGPESLVAVVPDPDACKDCLRLYLDPKTGQPKLFKLSDLMENEGTNYIRPWRQNARPVVPPLHPHCFCRLRYVPPGWGWNDEGRFTVVDPDKYGEHLRAKVKKSVEILQKADDPHSMLNDSLQHIPSEEEIRSIGTEEEAMKMAERLSKIKELHIDDVDKFYQIDDLQNRALVQAMSLAERATVQGDQNVG